MADLTDEEFERFRRLLRDVPRQLWDGYAPLMRGDASSDATLMGTACYAFPRLVDEVEELRANARHVAGCPDAFSIEPRRCGCWKKVR